MASQRLAVAAILLRILKLTQVSVARQVHAQQRQAQLASNDERERGSDLHW